QLGLFARFRLFPLRYTGRRFDRGAHPGADGPDLAIDIAFVSGRPDALAAHPSDQHRNVPWLPRPISPPTASRPHRAVAAPPALLPVPAPARTVRPSSRSRSPSSRPISRRLPLRSPS